MSKVATITFVQGANDARVLQAPQNYTYVNGIYGPEVTPQFLNAKDNVQHSPAEILKAEQAYLQQEDLRFFRIL
jgi:hypothetical protein